MRVYAWDMPEGEGFEDRERVHIADIVLKSKLFTSLQGDARLYFQHLRVGVDREVWPREWKKADTDFQAERQETAFPGILNWPETDEEAREKYVNSIMKDDNGVRGCPFSWLWT